MLFSFILFAQKAAQETSSAPPWAPLVPLVIIMVLFFWMSSRSRRQEEQQRQRMLASLKKNDKVLTSAGIIGVIANISDKDDEVPLKIDESNNTRMRVLKSSIIRNYSSEEVAKEQAAREQAAKGKEDVPATKS